MVICRLSQSPDYLHPPAPDPNPGGLDALDAVQAPRVVMIGISGPRGMGKSTLAKGLATKLESPMPPIEVNWFPRKQDVCFYSETKKSIRDARKIDFHKLCEYLDDTKEDLLIGRKVKALKNPDQRLPDTIIVVVEGSLLFYNKKVCERLHVHLWVAEDCEETDLDFAKVFRNHGWSHYLSQHRQQLKNVPAAVLLEGGPTAPQLLESALQACQSATQP